MLAVRHRDRTEVIASRPERGSTLGVIATCAQASKGRGYEKELSLARWSRRVSTSRILHLTEARSRAFVESTVCDNAIATPVATRWLLADGGAGRAPRDG